MQCDLGNDTNLRWPLLRWEITPFEYILLKNDSTQLHNDWMQLRNDYIQLKNNCSHWIFTAEVFSPFRCLNTKWIETSRILCCCSLSWLSHLYEVRPPSHTEIWNYEDTWASIDENVEDITREDKSCTCGPSVMIPLRKILKHIPNPYENSIWYGNMQIDWRCCLAARRNNIYHQKKSGVISNPMINYKLVQFNDWAKNLEKKMKSRQSVYTVLEIRVSS